jgi:hypothetical protein
MWTMKDKHIAYEELEKLARSPLGPASEDPAFAHLSLCSQCREFLEDARFAKNALAPLTALHHAPFALRTRVAQIFKDPARPRPHGFPGLFRPWARPAFVAALVLLLLGASALWRAWPVEPEDPFEVAWVIDLDDDYPHEAPALSEEESATLEELDSIVSPD